MSNKQFISNLSATYADVRKLDVKKINLKGKNILEYIKENTTIILDERGTKADDELDIWNSYVTKDVNGNVIINRNAKPHVHSLTCNEDTDWENIYEGMTETQHNTLNTAIKVIDNEVLGANDEHIMYWQTDGLTIADYMLYYTNLESFNSNLSSLTDGDYMFYYCEKLESFTSDLSSLTDGDSMFSYCENLSEFSSDLSNLTNGRYMFRDCKNLKSFASDLSSLTNGEYMFYYCEKLESFTSDLSSLTNGDSMFYYCKNLESFTYDLSSLTNGKYMFYECSNLTTFSTDLSNLTDGSCMFYYCTNFNSFSTDLPNLTDGSHMFRSCSNLNSFSSDLSSLTNGYYMFNYCKNLTSFSSDLSSLTNGARMFQSCKLDAQSVANIIHFIPQRDTKPTDAQGTAQSDGNIYIGVGITNTDAAKQTFAEECDCTDWAELNKEFDDKNWAVQWQFNGEATTFDLRGERPSTSVYAKLEEVIMPTEEEIVEAKEKGERIHAKAKERSERIETPHYEYTSQDGSKFYNINWYHDSNTNNEGYDYFESLEEAISAYSVISKA